jgi:acyl-CoA synthetase (AMP-forming)/AMP-acid ligase II
VSALETTNRILTERGEITLGALGEEFERRRVGALGHILCPVAFVCISAEEGVGAAACLARRELDGLILPQERVSDSVSSLLRARGYAIQLTDGTVLWPDRTKPDAAAATSHGREPTVHPGRISLLTSGTTGVPKLVHHRWDSLFTLRRVPSTSAHRWLLTYQTGTYAWFQMLTMILFVPGTELVVPARIEPIPMLELAQVRQARAISSTPTFWRFALLQGAPELVRGLGFVQITLGGERVDQAILDQLRARFPVARISHVYASSEVGAAIVVNDGREGFPTEWLRTGVAEADPERAQFRIEDGTLRVRSPYASLEHRGWADTGDSVEVRGDRVVILGRADSSFINVGGLKVVSSAVEEVLLQHSDVAWCRVYARSSALTGALVAADVVLRTPAANADNEETKLARHAADLLPEHAVPRIWRVLDSIPMTGGLKSEVA